MVGGAEQNRVTPSPSPLEFRLYTLEFILGLLTLKLDFGIGL